MFPELIAYHDIGLLGLRLTIGAIFLVHALPKLRQPKVMAQLMGVPRAVSVVWFHGLIESVCALAMIIGFYTQIAAFFFGFIMLGAIYFKSIKWNVPFSAMDKTGWEFDLILLAVSLALVVNGGGALSLFS